MKINHRGSRGIVNPTRRDDGTLRKANEELDKLRAANSKAVERAATLQVENEALKKRNAELLTTNKRLIAEAVKK